MARPTEYNPEFHPQQAKAFCLLGYTNKELAQTFGVSESTLNRWKNKFWEFWDACRQGKEIADAEVAQALFKRATGFDYEGEKIVTLSIGDGCSQVERVPITVKVLPDAGAALKWLQNRQPLKWRDKIDIEHSGQISTNDLSSLTDEQIEKRLLELKAKQ